LVSLDKAIVAKYESQGLRFEAYVDSEAALRMKRGESVAIDDVVVARELFNDAPKGKRVTDEDLEKVFGTTRFEDILPEFIKKADIPLTTDQKRKIQVKKRKQVIDIIARSAVDPRTHTPHPRKRVELAMDEAHVHVDPTKRAEEQVEDILKELKKIMPIKMETDHIRVKIPAEQAPKAYGFLKKHKMIKEEWRSDGSFVAVVELPAGMQSDFYTTLNKMTNGRVESDIIEHQ